MIEPSPFHADTANDINDTGSIVDYFFVFDFHAFFIWKNEKSKTLLRKREKELGQNMIERCLTSSSRVGYLILLENFWSHISRQLTQLEALKLGQLFNGTGLVNLPGSTTTRSRNSLLRYIPRFRMPRSLLRFSIVSRWSSERTSSESWKKRISLVYPESFFSNASLLRREEVLFAI